MDWRKTSAYQPHESWAARGKTCNGPVHWLHHVGKRVCQTCGADDLLGARRPKKRAPKPAKVATVDLLEIE